MPTLRTILATAVAAIALAATAPAAFAAPGVVTQYSVLYAGPDANSAGVGKVGGNMSVDIIGCSGGWCQINAQGAVGYVPQSVVAEAPPAPPPQPQPQPPAPQPGFDPGFNFDFNFGNGNPGPFPPQHPPRPPRPPVERQSGACFYSSTNFRGDSFCLQRGQSYDYLPGDWDDTIRSVEVFGRARVDLCRDEELDGACVTLRSSQSRLPSQLDRRASSLEVY